MIIWFRDDSIFSKCHTESFHIELSGCVDVGYAQFDWNNKTYTCNRHIEVPVSSYYLHIQVLINCMSAHIIEVPYSLKSI